MHISYIEVGKTYSNKGAGKTSRTVVAIGPEHLPSYCNNKDGKFPAGCQIGVLYYQQGKQHTQISLRSFAAWAGEEAE